MSSPSGTFSAIEAAPIISDSIGRISFGTNNIDDEAETHPQYGQKITQTREQNAPIHEMKNPDSEYLSRPKRRKLSSKVWKEFTKYKEDGKEWAICKYCERLFDGSSKKGTTHLKNHLESCKSKRIPVGGADKSIVGESVIGQELIHLDQVRDIIKYGFSSLKPIRAEVIHFYKEEKEKLSKYLVNIPHRFSLKIEPFDESDSIMTELHFIDDSWRLKKKVINFLYDERDRSFLKLKDLLLDLSIDKDMCCMVTPIEKEDWGLTEINSWLNERSSLPFGGKLLPIRWLTENLRIENGPKWMENLLKKIKKSFEYVFETPSNNEKFRSALYKAKSMGIQMTTFHSLVPLTWHNQGFKTLEKAVAFKEAFFVLEQIDPDFESINLSKQEWDEAIGAFECAKVLKDAAESLSESKYTTSNVYFPKVCFLYMKLLQWEKGNNSYVFEIASYIREEYFNKYWSTFELALVIAIVLDTRFKLDIVECWYKDIYGDDEAKRHFKEITDDVKIVYFKYAKCPSMLDAMGRPCLSSQITSAQQELDHYLKEPKFPSIEEFDILAWWCDNSANFPTLARMASDFLAIPISNTGISDPPSLKIEFQNICYSKSLDVEIRNALICAKSWLESPQKN